MTGSSLRDDRGERRAPRAGADDRDARAVAISATGGVRGGDSAGRVALRHRAAGLGAALAPRQLHRRPVAEHEPDRRAVEPERLAQPVLEVAPVAEVDSAASEAKNTNVGGAIAACVA